MAAISLIRNIHCSVRLKTYSLGLWVVLGDARIPQQGGCAVVPRGSVPAEWPLLVAKVRLLFCAVLGHDLNGIA